MAHLAHVDLGQVGLLKVGDVKGTRDREEQRERGRPPSEPSGQAAERNG